MKKTILLLLTVLLVSMVSGITTYENVGNTFHYCSGGDIWAAVPHTEMPFMVEDCSSVAPCESNVVDDRLFFSCGEFKSTGTMSKYSSYICDKNKVYGIKTSGGRSLIKDCGSDNQCFIHPVDGLGMCIDNTEQVNKVWCMDESYGRDWEAGCRFDSQCKVGEPMFETKEACLNGIEQLRASKQIYCEREESEHIIDPVTGAKFADKSYQPHDCYGPEFECPDGYRMVPRCFTDQESTFLQEQEWKRFQAEHEFTDGVGGALGGASGAFVDAFFGEVFGGGILQTVFFFMLMIVGFIVLLQLLPIFFNLFGIVLRRILK